MPDLPVVDIYFCMRTKTLQTLWASGMEETQTTVELIAIFCLITEGFLGNAISYYGIHVG